MSLVEQLKRLHRDLPGCEAVVFGDIRTGTVLWASAHPDLHQEDHDACLAQAFYCFGPEASATIGAVLGAEGDNSAPDQAILHTSEGTRLFMQSGEVRGEVVCVTLSGSAEVDGLAALVRDAVRCDD